MKRASRSSAEQRHRAKPSPLAHVWLVHHFHVFFSSLEQIARTPLPSLMTMAVIGIALALPTGLYLFLENIQLIGQDWGGNAQISLFLKKEVDEGQAHLLADQIYQRANIQSVQVITPAEALEEYRNLSGFGEVLTALKENPLPSILVLQLATPETHTQTTEHLLNELRQLKEVEIAQFDMRWLERLSAIVALIRRAVWLLASLLSLAVLLVIGNTIRLAIYNRRDEIEVNKLVGATDAFIRRPFLYTGFWYGFMGGWVAWFIVNFSFWLLQNPVKQLTALYYSQFKLTTLDLLSSLILLCSGALLGFMGAWLAVGRHLKDIQPH